MRRGLRQGVDHPLPMATCGYHSPLAQIGEVLGDDDLRLVVDHRLEVADAEWRRGEQIENPETGFVAETLVNGDQVQAWISIRRL